MSHLQYQWQQAPRRGYHPQHKPLQIVLQGKPSWFDSARRSGQLTERTGHRTNPTVVELWGWDWRSASSALITHPIINDLRRRSGGGTAADCGDLLYQTGNLRSAFAPLVSARTSSDLCSPPYILYTLNTRSWIGEVISGDMESCDQTRGKSQSWLNLGPRQPAPSLRGCDTRMAAHLQSLQIVCRSGLQLDGHHRNGLSDMRKSVQLYAAGFILVRLGKGA